MKAGGTRGSRTGRMMPSLFLFLAAACVQPPEGPDKRAIAVGALLPFTGDIGASGTNIERALLMVTEQINQAGGIVGKDVRIASRDTHSDVKRGLEAARSLIEDAQPLAVLGPENDDLAVEMVPLIRTTSTVQISGGVTSPIFTPIDDGGYWFRTCPSAQEHGHALAERMHLDGVRRAAILTVSSRYGYGFAAILVNELNAAGIDVVDPMTFRPDEPTYSGRILELLDHEPDAIVLVAYPKTGAAIIQEWAILGGGNSWYFSPTLKADVFIDNVPPGLLEGAVGVAPTVAQDDGTFALAFSDRWDGDVPLDVARFYYDAAALTMLAAAAASDPGRTPTGSEVRDRVIEVSRPGGAPITWDRLEEGLALLAAGEEIDYQGVSGEVDLDDRGDLEEGRVAFWTIDNDRIVPLVSGD